jgi:hypothetical protein
MQNSIQFYHLIKAHIGQVRGNYYNGKGDADLFGIDIGIELPHNPWEKLERKSVVDFKKDFFRMEGNM